MSRADSTENFLHPVSLVLNGGVFGPSLFMSAMLGASTTYVVVYLFSHSSLLANQLYGHNKNPFDEIHAKDEKYAGFKSSP